MRYRRITLGVSLLLLSACSERADVEPHATKPPPIPETSVAASAEEAPQSDETNVTVEVQSLDVTKTLIAAQKGRIVVVDLWALW